MKGVDTLDSTTVEPSSSVVARQRADTKQLVIGVPKEYRNGLLSKDAEKVWDDAAKLLQDMGYSVQEVSLPYTGYSLTCYYILAESDIASNMARYDGIRYGFRTTNDHAQLSFSELLTESRTPALNDTVKRRIFAGNFYNIRENRGRYFQQAAKVRRLIKEDFERVFRKEGVHALLTPVTGHSAPLYSEVKNEQFRAQQRRDDYFTQPANMSGLPAISVPFGLCSQGLPLGVQVICDYLQDDLCLEVADLLSCSA
ncbi:amidase [Aphelenchoides avenae]|nr:amidase [Aphelenchus avenae]